MIVRSDNYKISDVAYLLDLPSRHVIALCDAGVIATAREVANGEKKQRKRRFVTHDEVIRFNATRTEDKRVDVLSRLRDPLAEQGKLPFEEEAEQPVTPAEPPAPEPVVLSAKEWMAMFVAAEAVATKHPGIRKVLAKLGNCGIDVINRGLMVNGDVAA